MYPQFVVTVYRHISAKLENRTFIEDVFDWSIGLDYNFNDCDTITGHFSQGGSYAFTARIRYYRS